MTHLTLWSPAEEEKVGREYSFHKLFLAKAEPDEEDPNYFACDCGERLDFGLNSVPTAMCDKGHIWTREDVWVRVN